MRTKKWLIRSLLLVLCTGLMIYMLSQKQLEEISYIYINF